MKVLVSIVAAICVFVSSPARTADVAACIACHNDKMVANPILDGQHAKYIEKQLHDLKKDLRVHAQMQGIAKTLDDNQIVDISKAFASKKWANPNPKSNSAIQEEGKNLVRKGNCTRCHGSELEGTYNIPRLAGQRAQYLKTTLIQYKNKERNNFPPMSSMLNRYSEEEIGVMAEYIAGLAHQE